MPRQPSLPVRRSPVLFVTASIQELRRVTWPQRTLLHHSTVVALVLALMMIVLLLVDSVGSIMFEWFSG